MGAGGKGGGGKGGGGKGGGGKGGGSKGGGGKGGGGKGGGGKGGGGKGGGGKGGGILGGGPLFAGKGGGGKGGKGKNGGGGATEVTLCLTKADYTSITAAFAGGTLSTKPSDGCVAGLMKVSLDSATAKTLFTTLISGLNLGVSKKKKAA